MDADYIIKEIFYKDKNGVTQSKKKKFFGFRYHLLVDVNYEFPIEYTVTKASKGEREQLKKQIENMDEDTKSIIKTLSADKGYDSESLIKFLKENGISPVIDIQNHCKDGDETKQYKNTQIVYTYNGNVSYIDETGKKQPMKYLGYDKIKETLRYEYAEKFIV